MKSLEFRFTVSRDAPFFLSLDDRQFTYGAFADNAVRLAENWKVQGSCRGDVIAFKLSNDAALPCCYLACAIGGFVACPILDSHHSDTVEYLLRLAAPARIVEEVPELDAQPKRKVDGSCFTDCDPASPFFVLFTTGSTGRPKAMLHSLGGVIGSALSFSRLTGISQHTNLYHVLPMAYMAGLLNAFFSPMMAGARLVEGPLFSPQSALDFWRRPLEQGVDVLSITPTIAAALCRLTRDSATIGQVSRRIQQVQCTSAPISEQIRKRFLDKFSVPLQNCYGMTEFGGPLTFQSKEDALIDRDWGAHMDEVEMSLRDSRGVKELWIRSPHAMMGYVDEGVISSPRDADGFMDTGDVALESEGRIQITGRRKDMIIRGGVNISPLRIESVIGEMPLIDDIAVIAMDHEFWGEQIVACVAPSKQGEHLENAVQSFARDHLAAYERPDKILILEAIPRSFIGKVRKSELKNLVATHYGCVPT